MTSFVNSKNLIM